MERVYLVLVILKNRLLQTFLLDWLIFLDLQYYYYEIVVLLDMCKRLYVRWTHVHYVYSADYAR